MPVPLCVQPGILPSGLTVIRQRAQQERAAAQGELYVHGQPAVAGAGDPLRGQRLRPAACLSQSRGRSA